jgi:acetyltransferase-like isoleucine patch superfamily enzyme
MIKQRVRQFIQKHPSSAWTKLMFSAYDGVNDLFLFFATLTGYIPLHTIRFLLYRFVFDVDIPRNSIIYWRCRFFNPSGVRIGHHSIVGNDAFLDGRDGICIGKNVNIASHVQIFTKEHDIDSPTFGAVGGPVFIEDMVYIGSRAIILPGVKVGVGAVVAAGAVVTRNVEPWTFVGGVPARFIRRRPTLNYELDTSSRALFQ